MSAATPVVRAHRTRRRRRGAKHWIGRISLYGGVLVVGVVLFFPIYWMLVSSIQPLKYALHFPPPLYPKTSTSAPTASCSTTGRWAPGSGTRRSSRS